MAREQLAAVSCAPSESANLLITDSKRKKSFSHRCCRLLSETIVFFFHNSIGYAIMLSVMMYSGWLFVSVILGMGVGYFLFGHITMKVNMENINVQTTATVCPSTCPETGTSTMGLLNFSTFIQLNSLHLNFDQLINFVIFLSFFAASKTPSPCSTDLGELCQAQTVADISPNPCYENKIACESSTTKDCQADSVVSPTKTETVNDEDCCCRL